MDASGALDSLLGRLTTVLVNEAQLLGGVRSDVEFIKDEMESMNGLILHLTEAQHRDHQVRAWMKQVVGLTRDCEGNVELYIHYVGSRPGDDGLLGYLRRVLRFVRTIPVRHRIATRIQELKVRARDVGDRRQRYGVTMPELTGADMNAVYVEPSRGEEDLWRRAVLLDAAELPPDGEEVVKRGIDSLMKWLSMPPATEDGVPQPQVRVFSILGGKLGRAVAEGVYQQHSSVASIFGCKAWSGRDSVEGVLADILKQAGGVQSQSGQEDEDMKKRIISKRFLIVVAQPGVQEWKQILHALLQAADECLPGSAIIMTTENCGLALSSSRYHIIDARSSRNVYDFYDNQAIRLGAEHNYRAICEPYHDETFAMKMFLHLLYVNPNRTKEELDNYRNAFSECRRLKRSIPKQVLLWCYNELPSKYRRCLLYLTIFPEGHVIRTTSLARRWVAEGLVTATAASTPTDGETQSCSTDEAEHCLDLLFTRGFVSPVEIGAAGNIKSCTVHCQVREFIARVASDVNFVDSSLPPHLARHLSIHSRIVLPKSHSGGDSRDIAASLPSLAKSSHWKLLKVLDLEGCHSLEKQHLKSICKILLLKYLSLRNTDVTELPKQIKELQCLETLDIRQTKVQMLAKKAIMLPLLKHFLAGLKVPAANDSTTSQDSFSAVQIPHCIEKMNNMEILSHVRVSNSKELAGTTRLLKLRKLGVALHGKNAKLSDLFLQIEKLNECLRSLSIRVDPHPLADSEIQDVGMVDPLPSIPEFIERLNISGITGGLRHLIPEHHKLTKITLCEAQLKNSDLTILGTLGNLQCLRLQHNSYTESEVVFHRGKFQNLNYLLVEFNDVTKIRFCFGAAPKLERIVWSFARMDTLCGLSHLSKLKKLELNGDCDLDPIVGEVIRHPNNPTLKHKPHPQHQENRSAVPTSSSSAP